MNLRRQQPKDSLDMLLDTMCNAFGGIILLAVLVALLARQNSDATSNSSDSEEMMMRRIAQSEDTLSQTRASIEELTRRSREPSIQQSVQLAANRSTLQQQLRDLQSLNEQEQRSQTDEASTDPTKRLQELNEQLAKAVAARVAASNSLETVTQESERLRNRLADIRRQTAFAQQQLTQRLRLPKERNTGKDVFNIIVQHGKVYPLLTEDRVRNTAMVQFTPAGSGTITIPKPDRGFDPRRDAAALAQFFRRLPRGEYYLAFFVFEDSFTAFNTAKQSAVTAGLDYGWMPLESKEAPISFGAVGTQPKAQ